MKIILIGPPGSGKGTQAEMLKKKFNIPHISSGDVLRGEVARQTEFGKLISGYMDKGEIGPQELITEVILKYLDENCGNGFIFDGFPRTIYQAEKLSEKHPDAKAILLHISEQEITDRITGRRICLNCNKIYNIVNSPPENAGVCDNCGTVLSQRSDDNLETIRTRMQVYNKDTRPVVEFYKKKKLLSVIEGNRDSAEIFSEILKLL